MEAASYQDCVQRSGSKIGQQLQDIATRDRQLLQEVHWSNKIHILKAEEITQTCLANTQKARKSLMKWESDGMTLPWTTSSSVYSHSCTTERRNQTAQFLGQNFQRYEDEASDTVESYIDDSQSSFGRMHAYAEERFAYDLQYFVTDRVQPALDYLAEHTAKIQTVAVTFELDLSLLESRFRETLVKLETLLEKAKHHIDVLQEKLEAYKISIVGFHAGYADLYHRMELTIDFAQDVMLPGVPLPDFFGLSGIHVAEYYLPNTSLNWPELELDYQGIHDLLDEAAQQCMIVLVDIMETLQAQATQQLRGAMQELAKALMSILELKDYHPPAYQGSHDDINNIDEELEYQSERGRETQEKMREALENLRLQGLNVDAEDIFIPKLPEANYSYVDNDTTFEYLAMFLPSINIPKFLEDLFVWLLANTFVLEIAIQVYRVWKLESVYAKGAKTNLPEINCDDEKDESESYHTKYLVMVAVVKCLLRPHLFIIALLCLIFGVITVRMWLPHVQQSCVDTREGTFLARNTIAPVLINKAKALGWTQYRGVKFTCQQSQRELCSDIAGKALAKHQTHWTAFHTMQAQYNKSREALSLLEDCLESDTMSALMNESCCGLKGYNTTGCQFLEDLVCPIDSSTSPPTAFLPLETYLSDTACHPEFEWSLSDAQYSCEGLVEVCQHIPCAGVDEDLIRFHTIETDCEVEQYAIQCSWFILWAIIHAVVINVIFTLLLHGIRRVTWRHLNPNGFKFTTRLNSDGTISNGSTSEEREALMEKKLAPFEMLGKLQLLLGIFLLVVYLIAFPILIMKHN